ncbi:MAG: hypothetical protein HY820_24015 [Acidobacteria bacterium]|nr:hypothetical protein [Acidobacteriota bacterium]
MTSMLLTFLLLASALSAQTSIDIRDRRELFVDRLLIDRLTGASLRLHSPFDRGTVLKLDAPWEGLFSGYFTIIKDGPTYRMYSRGRPEGGRDGTDAERTCYAESSDGVHFSKPKLAIHAFKGTTDNNIILAGMTPFSHNFAPFLDSRPGVPAAERYKALAGIGSSGLAAFVSADGIHWSKWREAPVLPPGPARYDSQNLAFYSESEKRYVCYFRTFRKVGTTNYRWISRATSDDFVHWSPGEQMEFDDAPLEHLYTNQTSPYFRAPHLSIAIAARFFPGRQVLSDSEAREIQVDPKYFKDVSDAVLFTTRGGLRYDRTFPEAFLRPGVGLANWVSRTNYPAWNIVPTGAAEMSLYVSKNYGQPTAHIQRYSLRTDGFASLHAGYSGGEMVTKPLVFQGRELELNFATSAAGGIRVEFQTPDGAPIAGFALADSPEIIGDAIERPVRWASGKDLSALTGKPVRMRLVLKDADVFAFRFR